MDNKYKALIGLEMHCEISETNTKVFSGAKNGSSTSNTDEPNINIRPVDMAFPGTLPVVNKEAVKKALMASLILNCKQPEYIYFERKNYYYPDLPKGYQITQDTKPAPVGMNGSLTYEVGDKTKTIILAHLSETNNTPEKALEAIKEQDLPKRIKVYIADQYEAGPMIEV